MRKSILPLTLVALLCGCSKGEPTPEEKKKEYVTNYALAQGLQYTGYLLDGKPEDDNGYLLYSNDNSFTGKFVNGLAVSGNYVSMEKATSFTGEVSCSTAYVIGYTNGKLSFADGQYYQGKFVNNLYEDTNGIFSYSHFDDEGTTIKDVTYQGGFVAGSNAGQIGSITYPSKADRQDGLWSVSEVEMVGDKEIKANQDCIYEWYTAGGNFLFTGEGFYDGTSANYVPDTTYLGQTNFFNGCTYTGEYMNGNYNGQGKFVWDFSDGYSYIEGTFVNGSPVGQVCTKYFPCCFTQSLGCWNFKGVMGSFESPAANQQGSGRIKYEDNSIYSGGIYFNGDFGSGWLRNGEGTIDASVGEFLAIYIEGIGESLGAILSNKLIAYIDATFDKDINFMKGDGIFYIMKADRTPYGYLQGKWNGLKREGDYEGEMPTLREGYTLDLSAFI